MSTTINRGDTIRSYFDAIDANDIERVLSLYADDVVYERPGYDAIDGKQQLRHFFVDERVIASGRHRIDGVIVDGDRVSAWGSFAGLSRTGAELNERWCDVYEFRDALIARRCTYFFRPAV
jgi:ketosteroid isomerase-like protein